ncbi:hypothetical protein HDV05_005047 [Chytridiales sp. JEL 0842]|nr:hypothetical protein HDV05_005047 [Chytridiales sp. JEL 0842]
MTTDESTDSESLNLQRKEEGKKADDGKPRRRKSADDALPTFSYSNQLKGGGDTEKEVGGWRHIRARCFLNDQNELGESLESWVMRGAGGEASLLGGDGEKSVVGSLGCDGGGVELQKLHQRHTAASTKINNNNIQTNSGGKKTKRKNNKKSGKSSAASTSHPSTPPASSAPFYIATYLGSDDDFLMQSTLRKTFKDNALESDDAVLFRHATMTVWGGPAGTPLARIRRLANYGLIQDSHGFHLWWSKALNRVNVQTTPTSVQYQLSDMKANISIKEALTFKFNLISPRLIPRKMMDAPSDDLLAFLNDPAKMRKWLEDPDLRSLMLLKTLRFMRWRSIIQEQNTDPITTTVRDAVWNKAPRVAGFGPNVRYDVLGNVVIRGVGSFQHSSSLGGDVEHIHPRSLGGKADASNLCLLNARINRYKRATPILMCIDERIQNKFKSMRVTPEMVDSLAKAEGIPIVTIQDPKEGKIKVVDPNWTRKSSKVVDDVVEAAEEEEIERERDGWLSWFSWKRK